MVNHLNKNVLDDIHDYVLCMLFPDNLHKRYGLSGEHTHLDIHHGILQHRPHAYKEFPI
jgi:hypothetical protein